MADVAHKLNAQLSSELATKWLFEARSLQRLTQHYGISDALDKCEASIQKLIEMADNISQKTDSGKSVPDSTQSGNWRTCRIG